MRRDLKVCKKWQGEKNVPSIQLQGLYLKEFGFDINDYVSVELCKDEIHIKKMSQTAILKRMVESNPSLGKFIVEFDCTLCE